MEKFVIDVAPPPPLADVPATLDDLRKHPELYYQVCSSNYPPLSARLTMDGLLGCRHCLDVNIVWPRLPDGACHVSILFWSNITTRITKAFSASSTNCGCGRLPGSLPSTLCLYTT